MQFLASIVELWEKQIRAAKRQKEKQFGEQATECWKFYTKKYKDIYLSNQDASEAFPEPNYKLRLALAREFVNLMLPFVHYRVPHRMTSAARPPLDQELAELFPEAVSYQQQLALSDRRKVRLTQQFLNWNHWQYDLSRENRIALPEALVKGRCVQWTELAESANGLIPASLAESVDGLLIDPDCIYYRDAGYIVRERNRSAWRIADDFKIPVGELRAAYKSKWNSARDETEWVTPQESDVDGSDIVTYYEIYSRMGIGTSLRDPPKELKDAAVAMEGVGQHVWLVIIPGLDYPANLPPVAMEAPDIVGEIKERLSWPIPFYGDINGCPWPAQTLDFLPNCDNPWATSPLAGALPLLRFLDRAYSFMMGRVRTTCRDIIITSNGMEEALKAAIREGLDQSVVGVNGDVQTEVRKLFHVLQFPNLNADFYKALSLVQQAFERHTGMTPLLYGQEGDTQIRVAADIQAREKHVTSRPQDYADAVEAWQSRIARAEMVAARLMVEPIVIARMVGEPAPSEEPDPETGTISEMPEGGWGPITQAWMNEVHTDNEKAAASEVDVSVEAGTGRRKNKQTQAQNLQQVMQAMGPIYQMVYQSTGNAQPLNALAVQVAEYLEMPPEQLMIPDQPPPPQPDPQAEQEAMLQQQQQQQEMMAQQQQMQMGQKQQAAEVEMAQRQAEMEMNAQTAQQEMMAKQLKHVQDLRHKEEQHQQRLKQRTQPKPVKK